MNGNRAARAWRLVSEQAAGARPSVAHICAALTAGVGVDGAGLTVMTNEAAREMVHGTDQIATNLEELQLTLGQGPCVDAFDGGPVLVADLDAADWTSRWPVFAPAALDLGARAVFALPLQIGAVRLGAIDLYRRRPGSLTTDELADALALADAAVVILLDGTGPTGPDAATPHHQAAVHNAAGMISVQLGVRVDAALVRLRAYAFAHDRRLIDVARDVVDRRLRFHPDSTPEDQR